MHQVWFLCGPIVAVSSLALFAFAVGRSALKLASLNSTFECPSSLSIALGLGLVSHLIFVLGLFHILSLFPLLAAGMALMGCCLAFRPDMLTWRMADAERRPRAWALAAALLVILCGPLMLLSLYPPTSWDATMYHLALAKHHVQTGGVDAVEFMRFCVFPQVNEMLFAAMLLFSGDVAAQMVQLLMTFLIAALLAAWGRETGSPRAGIWAAALWLGNPVVAINGTIANVDVGLALFAWASVYCFLRWYRRREPLWALWAGTFAGLAAGSKYTGLFFVAFIGAAISAIARHDDRRKGLVFFIVAAGVSAAPWYLFNAHHMGNPFFPFFGGIFGYGNWNAEDLHSAIRFYDQCGDGKSLLAFLKLPWSLYAHPDRFASARLSPFYPALAPLALLARCRPKPWTVLFGLAFAYLVFWFLTFQYTRYLTPVLPLASAAAGLALDRFFFSLQRPDIRSNGALTWLLALTLAAPGTATAVALLQERGALPTSSAEREEFLTKTLPSYPAYSLLNSSHGDRYRIYSLYDENMNYFADGVFMGDWFGPGRFREITEKLHDSRELYFGLRALEAQYFLVSESRVPVPLPDDEFFRRHFHPVPSAAPVKLFKLREITE